MREIRFRKIDFDPIFESKGIDPESITDAEWMNFMDSFIAGTHWAEVAEIAAEDMRYDRKMEAKELNAGFYV